MNNIVDSKSLKQYKKDTNFFETPPQLAQKMAELIDDVGRNAKILEPSAGNGALIKAFNNSIKYPIQTIDFCETQQDFVQELTNQGYNCVETDFLSLKPTPIYDAIIMNPPYRACAVVIVAFLEKFIDIITNWENKTNTKGIL